MREVKDFLLPGFAIALGLGFTFSSGIGISRLVHCWRLSVSRAFGLIFSRDFRIGFAFLWQLLRVAFLLFGRACLRGYCFWLLRGWVCYFYVFFSVHVCL